MLSEGRVFVTIMGLCVFRRVLFGAGRAALSYPQLGPWN